MSKPLIDSLTTRRAMVAWLEKHATVTLECLPEDIDPAEHFDNPEDVAFARSGNPWAWFCAKVTVSYGDFSATDYLGACSYHSEADFKQPGGSFTVMVHYCCVDLVAQLMTARETAMRIWDLASSTNPAL